MIKILVYALTEHLGGIENFYINFSNNMNNIQMDFLSLSINLPYVEKLAANDIFYLPRKKEGNAVRCKRFEEIIHSKKYDYFWFNGNDLADIEMLKIAKRNKLKVICHAHNSKADKFYRKIMHYYNRRHVNRFIDYKFACSSVAAKWFFGYKSDIKFVYNAIDVEKYKFDSKIRYFLRNKLGIEENAIIIGNVGRLCKQKNQMWLINTFNSLHKIKQNTKLIILGQGELEVKLKNYVKKLGIENEVIFMGQVQNVSDYLMAFDMLWMPSLYEGLPVTLVEAQAAGLPCIASEVITKEVNVTSLIEYLPINNSLLWENRLYINNRREDGAEKLQATYFNVTKMANELEEFFEKERKK